MQIRIPLRFVAGSSPRWKVSVIYCLAAAECEFLFYCFRGFVFWTPMCKFLLCFFFEFPLVGFMRELRVNVFALFVRLASRFFEDICGITPGLAESEIRSKISQHNG